jgi:hypothetical protein
MPFGSGGTLPPPNAAIDDGFIPSLPNFKMMVTAHSRPCPRFEPSKNTKLHGFFLEK